MLEIQRYICYDFCILGVKKQETTYERKGYHMKQLDSNLNANEQNNINGTSRTQQIKTYLKRRGEGEDL